MKKFFLFLFIILISTSLNACKTLDALDDTSSKVITKAGGKPADKVLDAASDAASNSLRGQPRGTYTNDVEEECLSVCASKANVRQSPNISSKIVKQLYKEDKVTFLEEENGWDLIKASDGTKGWVSKNLLSKGSSSDESLKEDSNATNKTESTDHLSVYVKKANVRQSPNTNSKIVKKLRKNDQVTLLEKNNDWDLIQASDGTKGWVNKSLLK